MSLQTKTNNMIKTKFFVGGSCSKIETEINDFLTSEKVEYVDIKFGAKKWEVFCVLVYTEIKNQNNEVLDLVSNCYNCVECGVILDKEKEGDICTTCYKKKRIVANTEIN